MIYLDNASTSFPKAPTVADTVGAFIANSAVNINRGASLVTNGVSDLVFDTRIKLAELFNAEDASQVIFTKNVTESLNILLKGLLRPGDHVLTTSMEHNAVMRPLVQLSHQGVEFVRIPCTKTGELEIDKVEALIMPNTRLIVATHASNVTGTIMPIRELGEISSKHNLYLIVDAAQSAGVLPIDMQEMNISGLAFTGHKSLLGPQGIGGIVLAPGFSDMIEPLISGGTGSFSDSEEVPRLMPDRFEAGTLNLPGIAGLAASLEWIRTQGISTIREHEQQLYRKLLDELEPFEARERIRIYGTKDAGTSTSVVSIAPLNMDAAELAYRLNKDFGIATRVGIHCAPIAHKTIGSFPSGTVRFSIGPFNEETHIIEAISALSSIL